MSFFTHLPTPSVQLLWCFHCLSLIFFFLTLTLISHHPFALYLGNYAVFALLPLAGVQLAMNWSVQRSMMASHPRGAVTVTQVLIFDVAKLHGPRNRFAPKITLVCLRLRGRGAAGAPGVLCLHVSVTPACPTETHGLPASILQGEIGGGAGAGPVWLLPVAACLGAKQLPNIPGGEAIVILLDTAERQLHHVSGPVGHQMQSVVGARTARAFVVTAAAVLPVTMVTTVVFASSRLRRLLRHAFLPINEPTRHSVTHGRHPQVSAAAHHTHTTFAIKAERLRAVPVLQRVADSKGSVHIIIVGSRRGQRLGAVELDRGAEGAHVAFFRHINTGVFTQVGHREARQVLLSLSGAIQRVTCNNHYIHVSF